VISLVIGPEAVDHARVGHVGAVGLGELLALLRALHVAPHEGGEACLLPAAGLGGALGVDAGDGAEGLLDVVAHGWCGFFGGGGGRRRGYGGGCGRCGRGLGGHGLQRHERRGLCCARQQGELLAHQFHLLRNQLGKLRIARNTALHRHVEGHRLVLCGLRGHSLRYSDSAFNGRCHNSRRRRGFGRQAGLQEGRECVEAAVVFHQLAKAEVDLEVLLDLRGGLRQRERVQAQFAEGRRSFGLRHVEAGDVFEQGAQARAHGRGCGRRKGRGRCCCHGRLHAKGWNEGGGGRDGCHGWCGRGGKNGGKNWQSGRLRGGRGDVDPEALALERRGGQAHALGAGAHRQARQLHLGAAGPEAAERQAQGAGLVGRAGRLRVQQRHDTAGAVLAHQRGEHVARAGSTKSGFASCAIAQRTAGEKRTVPRRCRAQ
jgi:hypothetical protein